MSKVNQILRYIQEKKIDPILKILESEDYELSDNEKFNLKVQVETLTELYEEISTYLDFNTANIVFEVLKANYKKHDTLITFYNDEDLFISKDTIIMLQEDWVFILGDEEHYEDIHKKQYPLYNKGFNMNEVKRIQTL